jgi:hypothetical protein
MSRASVAVAMLNCDTGGAQKRTEESLCYNSFSSGWSLPYSLV